MAEINTIEEKKLEIEEIHSLLQGYSELDGNRKQILLATLTGMRLAVEVDRQLKEKEKVS